MASFVPSSERPDRSLAGTRAGYEVFQRERARLVGQINESFEVLLESSNQLNRKLEESVAVGTEFAPIAGLWSQLDVIMRSAGIPDLAAQVKDEARRAAVAPSASAPASASVPTSASASASASAAAPASASAAAPASGTPGPTTPRREGTRTPVVPNTPAVDTPAGRASLRASMGLEGDGPTNKLMPADEDLPPGVAPGGGVVYGRD